jgi:antibiotic biosynthesis monooxygenase (ABM) superfamily enzyme
VQPLPLPVRIALTWVAIFPLVLLAQYALRPLVQAWPLPLATALTMGVVVPVAVIWAVPLLSRWYARTRSAGSRRADGTR